MRSSLMDRNELSDGRRASYVRRGKAFVTFALVYLAVSALFAVVQGHDWKPDPFVFVAYAVGALVAVILL